MIFCEYTSPIPGSALRSALLAVLMSTRAVAAAGVVGAIMACAIDGLAPSAAAPPIRPSVNKIVRLFCEKFLLRIIVPPCPVSSLRRNDHDPVRAMLHQPLEHFHFYSAQVSAARCVFSSTPASSLAGDPGSSTPASSLAGDPGS